MVYAAEAHIQYSISNIKSKVSYRMALEWWWGSEADFLQNNSLHRQNLYKMYCIY